MNRTPSDRAVALAAGLDTAIVVLFVAIGRRNHDREDTVAGLVDTAAPFLIALAAAWIVWRVWRRPLAPVTGLLVWATTLAGGMVLRRFVFDDGTAVSFTIVAGVFLLLLVGWRVVAGLVASRRPRPSLAPGPAGGDRSGTLRP